MDEAEIDSFKSLAVQTELATAFELFDLSSLLAHFAGWSESFVDFLAFTLTLGETSLPAVLTLVLTSVFSLVALGDSFCQERGESSLAPAFTSSQLLSGSCCNGVSGASFGEDSFVILDLLLILLAIFERCFGGLIK